MQKMQEKLLRERPYLDDPDEAVYGVVEALAIAEVLAEQGVSNRALLAGTGITRRLLHDPYGRVSTRQRIALYENAIRLSPDPRFGLTVGSRLHLASYGMYGFALLSSSTLSSAVDLAFKYLKLAGPLMEKIFVRRGPVAYLGAKNSLDLGEQLPIAVDIWFGSIISMMRDALASDFNPDRVELCFARPEEADRYREAWDCEVIFGTPHCRLYFDASLLERRLAQSSELTLKLCAPVCDRLLAEFEAHASLSYKVREWLMTSYDKSPNVESAARAFNVTSRTFRRKLAAENTSFRDLRCEVREKLATEYLKNTDLTTAEIAERVGFSDSANFRSAFKRWKNLTPTEYRSQAADLGVDLAEPSVSTQRL